jgi:hypothetical protein
VATVHVKNVVLVDPREPSQRVRLWTDGARNLLAATSDDAGGQWSATETVASGEVLDFAAKVDAAGTTVVLWVTGSNAERGAARWARRQPGVGQAWVTATLEQGTFLARPSVFRAGSHLVFGYGVDSNGTQADGADARTTWWNGQVMSGPHTVGLDGQTDVIQHHQVYADEQGTVGYLYADNHGDFSSVDLFHRAGTGFSTWGSSEATAVNMPAGQSAGHPWLFRVKNEYLLVHATLAASGAWDIMVRHALNAGGLAVALPTPINTAQTRLMNPGGEAENLYRTLHASQQRDGTVDLAWTDVNGFIHRARIGDTFVPETFLEVGRGYVDAVDSFGVLGNAVISGHDAQGGPVVIEVGLARSVRKAVVTALPGTERFAYAWTDTAGALRSMHTVNGGRSWSTPAVVAESGVLDFVAVADGNGAQVVVWVTGSNQVTGSARYAVRATPDGAWSAPVTLVDTTYVARPSVSRAGPTTYLFGVGVDSNGGSAADGANARSFTWNGTTMTAPVTVGLSAQTDLIQHHQVFAGPGGSVAYLYADNHADYGSTDLFAVTGSAGGTWNGGDRVVADVTAGSSVGDGYLARIQGVYVLFYTRPATPDGMDIWMKRAPTVDGLAAAVEQQVNPPESHVMVPAMEATHHYHAFLAVPRTYASVDLVWTDTDHVVNHVLVDATAWPGSATPVGVGFVDGVTWIPLTGRVLVSAHDAAGTGRVYFLSTLERATALGGPCEPWDDGTATCRAVHADATCFQSSYYPTGFCSGTAPCTAGQTGCAGAGTVCMQGNTCVRQCNAFGPDGQCGPGGACVNWVGIGGACHPLANAACRVGMTPSGCEPVGVCVPTGADGFGQCEPGCDIFRQDCTGATNACYPNSEGVGVCLAEGSAQPGQPCDFTSDCAGGNLCIVNGASGICRRLCRAGDHPCSSGTCTAVDGLTDVGVCS